MNDVENIQKFTLPQKQRVRFSNSLGLVFHSSFILYGKE
jgi:hypothetical protein